MERDSYTADPAGAARAVSGPHEGRRRPVAQQGARVLHDRETWCLSTNSDKHRSMGGEPPMVLLPETQEQITAGGEQTMNMRSSSGEEDHSKLKGPGLVLHQ